MFGSVVFSAQLGDIAVSETRYDPRMVMETHAHDRAYVSFVTEGRYAEHSREVPRQLHRNMLVFHPAGDVHADCVHDQSMATLNIEMGRASFPASSSLWAVARWTS